MITDTKLILEDVFAAIVDVTTSNNAPTETRVLAGFELKQLTGVFVQDMYSDGGTKMFIRRSRKVTLIVCGQPINLTWRDAYDDNWDQHTHNAYEAAAKLSQLIRLR